MPMIPIKPRRRPAKLALILNLVNLYLTYLGRQTPFNLRQEERSSCSGTCNGVVNIIGSHECSCTSDSEDPGRWHGRSRAFVATTCRCYFLT